MLRLLLCLTVAIGAGASQKPNPPDQAGRLVPLTNGGFESTVSHEGWSLHVVGAKPEVTLDNMVRYQGRYSLRVHADKPSDTAFGQELKLTPGRWYRLSGWVRTEKLDPQKAPVYGTFQIQLPGGREIIASGRNHSGTTDWVRESILFTPKGDGSTRISIFFVGFGKGTGTAWFDEITLSEVDLAVSTLTIAEDPSRRGSISPLQYGQFIEYLCALTPSMFAEKVFDGGFEGVAPYGRHVYRAETDRLEQPWYPDGSTHRGEYTRDGVDPFNGKVSLRIAQTPGDPCTLGISQGGLYVEKGQPLRCSLYLRATDVQEPVRVAIWGEGTTYAEAEFKPAAQWGRSEAILRPSGTDAHATLTISLRGPGTVWIDQVSLMPVETVFGWRRDVAEAIKQLKPGIIRFGGTAIEQYEWTATIGDPARRVPFKTLWGGLEPGNAGLEEFVQLCRWVGAQPLICVRFTGKTPKDAAEEVEYFNGQASTPMGGLRAANGHPEPYRVKYWQIGNELGDKAYQDGFKDFCIAMKKVDHSIRILASYPSPGLLKNAGQFIDYVCPHHYGCERLETLGLEVEGLAKMIAETAPGRTIRLGITEWNASGGGWGLPRARLWSLDNALWCSRYHNFMHDHCEMIEIACRSNLADSFCSGIIQTNNHSLFKTPTYYAEELYANHAGRRPLKIKTDTGLTSDPMLDVSATVSEDRKTVSIFAINQMAEPQKRTLDLHALAPLAEEAKVWTLTDTAKIPERDAVNSWQEPARVRTVPGKATLTDAKLVYEFAPVSLTVIEMQRRR